MQLAEKLDWKGLMYRDTMNMEHEMKITAITVTKGLKKKLEAIPGKQSTNSL
jgi:hypothetical protein